MRNCLRKLDGGNTYYYTPPCPIYMCKYYSHRIKCSQHSVGLNALNGRELKNLSHQNDISRLAISRYRLPPSWRRTRHSFRLPERLVSPISNVNCWLCRLMIALSNLCMLLCGLCYTAASMAFQVDIETVSRNAMFHMDWILE